MAFPHSAASATLLRLKELLLTTALGWIPRKPGIMFRGFAYRQLFNQLGRSAMIDYGVEFYQPNQIKIGEGVYLTHHVCLDASGKNNSIVLEADCHLDSGVRLSTMSNNSRIVLHQNVGLDRGVDIRSLENGSVEIGKGTYIGPYVCMAGPGHIKIGKQCMIASHTGIYANNHNFDDLTCPIVLQGVTTEGIVIEDDCWLGTGVKVMDGVTIGRGSVIGAGAVVTKDIPPYSVAVGVPAKVISRRDKDLQTQLKASRSEFAMN